MNITLLGQGYEAKSEYSVGNQLIKFFSQKEFHTFTGISAFVSQAGVNGLSKHITAAKKHFNIITIVTGVDQKGTSKEALEKLLKLNINTFVFYQPSFTIFHPKIYLFEGADKSELIIGSSNLTAQGLFTNVEASLLVSIDNSIEADRKIVEQLKDYFKGIFDFTDPNLKKLSKKLIADLVRANVVPTEEERKAALDKAVKGERKETENIISKIFPKRAIAKIPSEFRGTSTGKAKAATAKKIPVGKPTAHGKLLWTRKKLPSSSVQGGGAGTNPTGGLRLVQDDFVLGKKKISHTTYFRNKLFGKYTWNKIRKTPFVEIATIPFEITIKRKFIGKFDLEVRHKPSGEAGQGNYTTSISWGEVGKIISKAKLTGKRLDIYAPKGKGKPFHILIS
ncbi:MAG: NgoFVII family restriction endonuclease [Cytophagales bacterium]|nr:NgoFVII family restriction endonuclease [Cytophagales bacterium]